MEKDLEHIEQYLRNQLSLENRQLFEAEMESNSDLREAVEKHRQLMRGLELGFNRDLKSILQTEEIRIQHSKKKIKPRSNKYLWIPAIAASIAVIIVSIVLINKQNARTEMLFAQYYQVYPNIEIPISRSGSTAPTAYELYEQGQYGQSLVAFKTLVNMNPADTAANFYAGVAALELSKTQEAIYYFNRVDSLGNSKYSRPAVWYKALSFLKENHSKEAKKSLMKLQQLGGRYSDKASKILSTLR